MPYMLQGAPAQSPNPNLSEVHYDYDYLNGLNLRPGSELHEKIKKEILDRARESFSYMQQRHTNWSKVDETLTAYIAPSLKEEELISRDPRKPISIVVPVTYAAMETILTHWVASFLESPILRYRGVGPEDTLGAILLEKIVELHCNKTKVALALHTMMRDALAYGLGVVSPMWVKEMGRRTVVREETMWSYLRNALVSFGLVREPSPEITLFEGNALETVSPYNYLPDPNVAVHEHQKGEFNGSIKRTNRMTLLEDEASSGGDIFNAKYLKHIDGISTATRQTKEELVRLTTTKPIDVIYMYVNFIPSEWGIGKGDRPEKWLFAVAGDEVVLMAKPLGLDHNKFPRVVCAPEYDGYGATPVSKLEMTLGLQGHIDFLLNSHMANVRKAVNDRVIYDPMLVDSNDLKKSGAGGTIRLRSSAWGRGLADKAVQQLKINDVTQAHITDIGVLIDLVQRISSASDILQGIRRKSGERVSATEVRDVRAGGLSRINKMAKIISLMAMQDLANFFAAHTIQLMEEETYVKTVGRWEEVLKEEFAITSPTVRVKPTDLVVNYDVVLDEGAGAGGEYADTWVNLYGILAKNLPLASQFDMVRIFKHIARLLGASNISDFAARGGQASISVQPTGQVIAEAEKGNLVPIPGMGGLA